MLVGNNRISEQQGVKIKMFDIPDTILKSRDTATGPFYYRTGRFFHLARAKNEATMLLHSLIIFQIRISPNIVKAIMCFQLIFEVAYLGHLLNLRHKCRFGLLSLLHDLLSLGTPFVLRYRIICTNVASCDLSY
ncbi:hypothetical protein QTP88_025669 [Uroleucon formosanum]